MLTLVSPVSKTILTLVSLGGIQWNPSIKARKFGLYIVLISGVDLY